MGSYLTGGMGPNPWWRWVEATGTSRRHPQHRSKAEPDPTGESWLKHPRKAVVTPINPCRAGKPLLLSPDPPCGQPGWCPAGCPLIPGHPLQPAGHQSPAVPPPGMTAVLSPAQRPRQRVRDARSCMARSSSPVGLAVSAAAADLGRNFEPGPALAGCVEGFVTFPIARCPPGQSAQRPWGWAAGTSLAHHLIAPGDRWSLDADRCRWQEDGQCPASFTACPSTSAVVPGGGCPGPGCYRQQ